MNLFTIMSIDCAYICIYNVNIVHNIIQAKYVRCLINLYHVLIFFNDIYSYQSTILFT